MAESLMWVFGYGSLMWDGWENDFGCLRRSVAVLNGFSRTFNKSSTKNRGTKKFPCPTLNLEQRAAGICKGIAFQFAEERSQDVLAYLQTREGRDFQIERQLIRLDGHADVEAHVPVYRGANLVSSMSVDEMAAMVQKAKGTKSSCQKYVQEIAELLAQLNIEDAAVQELWQAVQRQKKRGGS